MSCISSLPITRAPTDFCGSSWLPRSRLALTSFCSASCKRADTSPCLVNSSSTLARVSAFISPEALICFSVASAWALIWSPMPLRVALNSLTWAS
ncbi:hypothetical protein D3C76_912630 [compost metagenome]